MLTIYYKITTLIQCRQNLLISHRFQIHVHSTMESLNEFVPKDMLPEEYGGQAGPIMEINRKW